MPERDLPPLIRNLCAQLDAELAETHASWVLLARGDAWKIKKPVVLPFLDYGTLAKRETACREELRLNRRLAPDLYRDVVPVGGTPEAPRLGGAPAIEWAVRMRRFDCSQQLDRLCNGNALQPAHLVELAVHLLRFQQAAAVAAGDSRFGTPDQVMAPALENFDELRRLLPAADQPDVSWLADWTDAEFARRAAAMVRRRSEGRVREGHGDLHLGNLVLIDGIVTPFDGIEFNAGFRWIDVASEVAFTWVDLLDHGRPDLAGCFLDAWREASGDTGALEVMRFYAVYRAIVRAKIAAIRAGQEADAAARAADLDLARGYLALARRIAVPPAPGLTITVGLSGSGKTTASGALMRADAEGGTLRLRSDVERKRLFGLDPLAASGSAVTGGIYTREANARTYATLRAEAGRLLAAGWPVVVDAAFLRRSERDDFRKLAAEHEAPFRILECTAPATELRARIAARSGDASEATVEVLEKQLAWFEPLGEDELPLRTVPPDAATSASGGV